MAAKFYLVVSSMARRYRTEVGSNFVNLLFQFILDHDDLIYTTRHSIIEIGSVLMRLKREGRISENDAHNTYKRFLTEANQYVIFLNTNKILEKESLQLMSKYPLKASDALQLACARDIYGIFGSNSHFVCADNKLCKFAQLENLSVLNPLETSAINILENLIIQNSDETYI